jgi:acetyl esterase/lipase
MPDRIDVGEMRLRMEEMTALAPVPAGTELRPQDAGGVPGEWVWAPSAHPRRVILYLHGGGYVIGSARTHRGLVARLSAASGARALSVDYRLAPEHPFPAAVEDATAAYRWLLARGLSPTEIVIAGDSAGGGLTVAALVALRDSGDPLPAAGVCISPWVDLEGVGESMTAKAHVDPMVRREGLLQMAAMYLAGASPRSPLAAPLHADLAGLPPLLVHVGTAETLLDDSNRLAARARAAGVEVEIERWEDMIHVWHAFAPLLPEAEQAIRRIGEYVSKQLG